MKNKYQYVLVFHINYLFACIVLTKKRISDLYLTAVKYNTYIFLKQKKRNLYEILVFYRAKLVNNQERERERERERESACKHLNHLGRGKFKP